MSHRDETLSLLCVHGLPISINSNQVIPRKIPGLSIRRSDLGDLISVLMYIQGYDVCIRGFIIDSLQCGSYSLHASY